MTEAERRAFGRVRDYLIGHLRASTAEELFGDTLSTAETATLSAAMDKIEQRLRRMRPA